jgi:hypothetical protein
MARLTPVNYNMQVLNPLQTAMAGYQAGFGQFQQLNEVRRQREADRMAAEKHGLQMELLRAQTAEQVRETERANAMQTALGTMWGRMADGENVTSTDIETMMVQFPELKDTLDTTYERLSREERETQFNSIFTIGMLGSEPDLFTAEMQRNIDARADNPDEQQVWQGMLEAYNAAEAQEPGGGAAAARLYAGISLLSLADNEEQRKLVESKFFPEPEKPLSPLGKLRRDYDQGIITEDEYNAQRARLTEARGPLVVVGGEQLGDVTEEAFAKAAGAQLAANYLDLQAAGQDAQRDLVSIDQLERTMENLETGTFAGLASWARNRFGLELGEQASDLQVAEALINQLVPQQRPPNSGTMSDADLQLFKRSLPTLLGSREGNMRIIQYMREIKEYDIAVGQIASDRIALRITQQEADERMAALTNPLAHFRRTEDLMQEFD